MDNAAPLAFNKGKSSVPNLKLTIGHPDCWSFNVNRTGKVNTRVNYSAAGNGAQVWSAALYDHNGNFVATISNKSINRKLAAGTYYVSVSSGLATLPGSYSLSVSGNKK